MSRIFWYYFFVGFVLLIFSLETTPLISIYGQVPDLILVFLVFLAQKKGPTKGLILGFFLGLFIDFFSGQLLGAQAFVKMTIGLLTGIIGGRLIVYSFQTEILIVFLSSIFQSLLFYLVLLIFSQVSAKVYFSGIWINIVYTTILSPLIILLLNFIDRKSLERF